MTIHSRTGQLIVLLMLPVMLAACAINDAGSKTAQPPITLNAPPAIVIEGNCEITGELEQWLQITVPTRQEFQSRLEEAAAKNAEDVHDDTLYLAGLRDTVAYAHSPDCGAEIQGVMVKAMADGVDALQAYFNHTLSTDLSTALAEARKGLSQAASIQNDLITRMRNQYQVENNMTPTPKAS
ncbi:MAG: hypothetical protein GC179_02995 [Anaerolineaceae bacterium]|nr:hypothetical protein [Anaerolineaceae bacterium]